MEGTITRFREGDFAVYATILDESGTAVTFRMRGIVDGLIGEGDRVRFSADERIEREGMLEVTRLENLTTNAPVTVWKAPLRERLTSISGRVLLPIAVSIVSAVVASLVRDSQSGGSGDSWLSAAVVVLVLLAVAAAIFALDRLYAKPARERHAALVEAGSDSSVAARGSRRAPAVFAGAVAFAIGAAFLSAEVIRGL